MDNKGYSNIYVILLISALTCTLIARIVLPALNNLPAIAEKARQQVIVNDQQFKVR